MARHRFRVVTTVTIIAGLVLAGGSTADGAWQTHGKWATHSPHKALYCDAACAELNAMTIDDQVRALAKIEADKALAAAKAYTDTKTTTTTVPPPPPPVVTPPPPPPPVVTPPPTPPPVGTPVGALGLRLTNSWEFSSNPSNSGWYVYDNSSGPNGELGYNTPNNVQIVTEGSTTFMRTWVKKENLNGRSYTSVMMENSGVTIGGGQPFYTETRMRWQSYPGFWGGYWLYQYPGNPAEIDVMETVNVLGATHTLHSPNSATTASAATNDGNWHTFGVRVDASGVYFYMDNVITQSLPQPALGQAFMNATMFPKIQNLVGGNWPNSDAGHTVPDASVTFPKYADFDFVTIYRP